MKSIRKLLIVDVVLLVISILLYKVPIISIVLISLTTVFWTYTILEWVRIVKENAEIASIPVEVQRRSLINEKLEKARNVVRDPTLIDQVRVRSPIQRVNDENGEFIRRADAQINKFESRERAFDTIIKLNEGGCSTTLTKNSLDVYETLVENYRRMSKRIVAYATTNNSDIKVEIEKFLESNDKLLNLYNRLIEEVSRMGDNLNEQDESLQNLISDLQELRKRNEAEDDDQDEENPFELATFPPKE